MSLSLIGLFLNWITELDFKRKWKKITERNYLPLVLAGLFLIELFWLSFSEDLVIGLNVLRIKLPLLLLPIIVGSSRIYESNSLSPLILFMIYGIDSHYYLIYITNITCCTHVQKT